LIGQDFANTLANFHALLIDRTVSSTVGYREVNMEKTNADDFRSNLKDWMEAARNEPIKITRKNGEAFVLINADDYENLQLELASLRGLAQGLSDVVQGRVTGQEVNSTKNAIDRAKAKVLGKKRKKAVG
jgi:antitoxin YefM